MVAICTPLRFPGGKTKLYPFVERLISVNGLQNCTYIEPFAGGAGLAMKLLLEDKVSSIVINDLDYAIYCVWDVIVNHSDDLCDFIADVSLDIDEWKRQREVYRHQLQHTSIEVGEAVFYLNRTNVSGVLRGGVIGGLEQKGKYKIDARFNRTGLIERVQAISRRRADIHIYNLDASEFVRTVLPEYSNSFVYFDPPYVNKGRYLYKNAFTTEEHCRLSETIADCSERWITTYDDCELINELYSSFEHETMTINYSAGPTKCGNEIMIYGPTIQRIPYSQFELS